MHKKATSDATTGFESSLEQLNTIVEELESGDLSLAESLEGFERGVKITREAQNILSGAEQKVQLLVAHGKEDPAVENFHEESKTEE